MNGKLWMLALLLGLAAALPTNNHKARLSRKNSSPNDRLGIFDGSTTTIAKHNYLVGLLVDSEFYCAGVIVSESYVLTLGDCAYGLSASEITVVAGSSDGTTGTSFTVQKIIMNPSYGDSSASYDFALLKVKDTFTFGTTIGAATLPSANPKSGAALVAAGWGDTSALSSVGSSTLKQGTMKYVTEANCETYYSDYSGVTFDSSMACAYNKGKTTMCNNDFGNPFTKGKVVYGLMAGGGSTDVFCNKNAIPVIIANVYTVVDWINKYI